MQNTLTKYKTLQKQYSSLLPIAEKDQSRLWKKFRLEWNYNSNHIEGNTLTYGETELLLIFDKTKGNHTKRELDEMQAHDVAIEKVREWAKSKRPLTQSDIRELNALILVKPFWKDAQTLVGEPTRKKIIPGEYKTMPNNVRLSNGEIFEYAAPEDVLPKMQELLDWYNEVGESDPIEVAALLHYRFVCIHPFDDGNGRVSRLLMNYHLMRCGLPPVIIKSKDKTSYLRALNEADAGDLEAFVQYIRKQMLWSLELSINAAKGEAVDESGDWKKKLEVLNKRLEVEDSNVVPKSNQAILDRFFENIIVLFNTIEKEVHKSVRSMFYTSEFVLELLISNSRIETFEDGFRSNSKMNQIASIAEKEGINEIGLKMQYKGFKKDGANTFNLYDKVTIKFDEFRYTLSYPLHADALIIKTYSEPFIQSEIEDIVNRVGERLINQIEANTKHK